MEAEASQELTKTLRELVLLDLSLLETLPFPWGLQEGNTENSFINRTLPQPETITRFTIFNDVKESALAETYMDFGEPTVKFETILISDQLRNKKLQVANDQPAQNSSSLSSVTKILNEKGVADCALVQQEIWQRLRMSFALILQGRSYPKQTLWRALLREFWHFIKIKCNERDLKLVSRIRKNKKKKWKGPVPEDKPLAHPKIKPIFKITKKPKLSS